MTTYAIYSDGGQELTSGIHGEEVARATAQRFADDMGETVYLDTVPTSTDPDDDEDCGEAVEPTTDRVSALLAELSAYDHGDGCLGIIVRQALQDDPDVTADEIADICRQAEADAKAEAERN